MSNILISCGGTGGHLAPGIAVGQALIKGGHNVSFIISEKPVDARLSQKYSDLNFIKSPGAPFSVSPAKFFKFIKSQFKAYLLAKKLMKGADAAIAFGGFTSFGISLAAIRAKKPLILHEANRKAGKAIRLFGRFATRIYVPYGVKISAGKKGVVRHAGYPVREEIFRRDAEASKAKFGFDKDAKILLVCGGSQGALALNKWAAENFDSLAYEGLDVLCISGPGKAGLAEKSKTDKNGAERFFKVVDFCDDMAGAMSASEIVAARAGAGSIAEFARCGVIPVLVPLPSSADNHQLENAMFVEKSGAGICVRQKDISRLKDEIVSAASNKTLCDRMRAGLKSIDESNDVEKIVADIESVISKPER